MKRDIAERFAALAVEGTTLDQARQIIATFLAEVARCPVCDGTGQMAFGRDMEVSLEPLYRNQPPEKRIIIAGSLVSCPGCGGDGDDGGTRDPEYVAWHCVQGWRDLDCQNGRRSGQEDHREEHAKCGYRIMLPLEASDDG